MRLERIRDFVAVKPELIFSENGLLMPGTENSETSSSFESSKKGDSLFTRLGGLKTIQRITEHVFT